MHREKMVFRPPARYRPHKSFVVDGRAPPHISELIMALVPGGASEKLSWLRQQRAAGKLDGDDPDEIAEAEALLAMLVRMGSKGGKEKRHLDELLDEGLKGTFPASDPVSVGHFTSTDEPSRPIDRAAVALARRGVARAPKARARGAAAAEVEGRCRGSGRSPSENASR